MENKIKSYFGGRVALNVFCEGHIGTTYLNQTKYNLKSVGLATGSSLLDQQGAL